ncbi:dipeptidase [Hyphococcus luteus]|uniref:Peptidase M19 n=1 Tax=Hyphococcus luteus TaxID=2058213 RepID=A0A2S7KAK0_9PROT|nr:membrane dipeptidase [Marinicaulis flavus]PQA89532.1 hypothetical protein CW354_01280 [Marinicaulis flavus]
MATRRNFLLGASTTLMLTACGKQPEADTALIKKAEALITARPSLDLHAHPGRTFVRGSSHLAPALKAYALAGAFEDRAIADMRKGGVSAAVFCAVSDFQILDLAGDGLASARAFKKGEALASYRTQISHLNALFDDREVARILAPADVMQAKKENRVGALLGVEGGDFLEGSAERVGEAYADGVRCINPLHYHTNELGDIMTENPVHDGLTQAGAAVIKAMNANGVMIDVAHASEKTAFGILDASEKPVLCSHTHIRTPNFAFPRFISLDLAKQIAAAGGVIGAWPAGIGISDLTGYVDRIFELIDAVGVDHVGLGSDMDANYKPVWDNYSQFPEIVALMLDRGLSEEEAAKIIGGNGLRVFQAASA